MDFQAIIDDLKRDKLAARRFEREGHRKFRDCVTVGRNGRLLYQLFSWGEAASLAFEVWGTAGQGGAISWRPSKSGHNPGQEPPERLAGYQGGALLFDDKPQRWPAAAEYKRWPAGGLGFWGMLLGG